MCTAHCAVVDVDFLFFCEPFLSMKKLKFLTFIPLNKTIITIIIFSSSLACPQLCNPAVGVYLAKRQENFTEKRINNGHGRVTSNL